MSTILAHSDTHFPWYSETALDAVYRGVRKYQPKIIVHNGDLYDMFSFGRFARTQDVCTPKAELELGRQAAETHFKKLRVLAPRAKIFLLRGNHDERPLHRILQVLPQVEALLNIDALFSFHNVETFKTERNELIIEDIVFIHGYLSEIGGHCRDMLRRVVRAHSHVGYVYLKNHFDKTLWELNVGYCADREAIPLSYTAQQKFSRWTLGYGVIDDNGPRFISA